MLNSTTIILRECGERTADAAASLLLPLAEEGALHRIRATPFSEALRMSLRKGLETGREFTLCIDADVLVLQDALIQLLDDLKAQPDQVTEIQGLVFDKFFMIDRPAGNHLYRTRHLEEALACIPAEGASVRPETDMLNAMVRRGLPWIQTRSVVGVHDWEQHWQDIYRTCFLQAHKHEDQLRLLLPLWKEWAESDPDFLVASEAAEAGSRYEGEVTVARQFGEEQMHACLQTLKLAAKDPLQQPQELTQILQTDFRRHPTLSQLQEEMNQLVFQSRGARLRQLLVTPGLGSILSRILHASPLS